MVCQVLFFELLSKKQKFFCADILGVFNPFVVNNDSNVQAQAKNRIKSIIILLKYADYVARLEIIQYFCYTIKT